MEIMKLPIWLLLLLSLWNLQTNRILFQITHIFPAVQTKLKNVYTVCRLKKSIAWEPCFFLEQHPAAHYQNNRQCAIHWFVCRAVVLYILCNWLRQRWLQSHEDALVNKSNQLRNTRVDLAIIMVTQCNVDSTSVLCTVYFKNTAEHSRASY